MKISVVIPAFNEAKLIGQTLTSIRAAARAFEERGWDHEVIVCDNNSTDATGSMAAATGAQVVFEPVNQISRARNRGAAAATGDWLVFVDADSLPSAGLFGELAQAIEAGSCVGGGALVRMETSIRWARLSICCWNALSRMFRWAAGSFVFCEAKVFRQLGGFSEELFISEEIDFSRRLKRHARFLRKQVRILRGHPLVTSPRKLHLYQVRDYLRVLWGAVRDRGASYRKREACGPWYDGRR
jgi:glycosyltransferase involved in cell wall biosynthesis